MPKFSVIIPVYNRPDEVRELLSTLVEQSFTDFEVLIIEDGSMDRCESVVKTFDGKLDIKYHFKENEGQGFARNYGYQRAKGSYFIVFDSDCLIPSHYLQTVDQHLTNDWIDAYGGPDTFHPSFTVLQKAISHTMTSFFTTGGIRGGKKVVKGFHPRSFNMGISKEVFKKTDGYIIPYMGEDMEFSTRLINEGFTTALIPNAFVYHKRRTSLVKFFKQLVYFGRARINLTRFHKGQLRLIHFMPLVFVLGFIFLVVLLTTPDFIGCIGLFLYLSYLIIVFLDGVIRTKSLPAGLLSPFIVLIQFGAYSYGLIYEWLRKVRGIDPNTRYIDLY